MSVARSDPEVDQSQTGFRFGPFEYDPHKRELRKYGSRIRIQRQPLAILLTLLESPNTLVTREELRSRIWNSDTFVAFEPGLNSAIKRLRDVLRDSADEPRYIETVPGEGYRFIASVERFACHAVAAYSKDNHLQVPGAAAVAARLDTTVWHGSSEPRKRKLWKIALASVLPLAALLSGAFYYHSRVTKPLSEKDTIVLGDFANSTGDPVFDGALSTALSVALKQSPFLNVLSESKVTATLQLMTRSATTKLIPDVALELCQRAGSKAYVAGSISALGTEYVVGLRAVNCQSGDTLAEEQVAAPAKEKVLGALGDAASKLRRELGESLASVRKFDISLEQATTPSLEALKAYSLGFATRGSGPAADIPYFQRAIELDPSFVAAYLSLGAAYDDAGASDRAQEYYKKAFQLRERASEPERLSITVAYYANVTGELDKAAQMIEEQIETYPRSVAEYVDQSFVYQNLGQIEKALELTRQNLRLDPDHVAPLVNLANQLLALQRIDETRQALHSAQAHNVDNGQLRANAYALAFVTSDSAGMAEQQKWFANHPADESLGLGLASDSEAYAGHLSKARELTMRSVRSALRMDGRENAAASWEDAALREAAFGHFAEAQRAAKKGLKFVSASRGIEAQAALAFAIADDTAPAESLAQDLNKRWPLDTQIQSLWLPSIQAQLALDRNEPRNALNALQPDSTVELGSSCLYSIYVRGEAYLAAGQGRASAAEFQKILDHNGIVWNCWTGALARLGVARANALQARTSRGAEADAARVRALAAFKDFLILWKDADPDIPILKEVKTEYAKLQ